MSDALIQLSADDALLQQPLCQFLVRDVGIEQLLEGRGARALGAVAPVVDAALL